jgi:hypothetical protein
MTEQAFQDSWWLFTRARGVGLVLRALVLLSPIAAVAVARLASGRSTPVIDIVVAVLTAYCVVVPDGHVGLLVVALVGVEWVVLVDDSVTPWSLGVALALLVFHTSLAAASIAAPAAVWSSAMCRRWSRRAGVLAVACVATWLVVLALGGLWLSDVTLDGRPGRRRPGRRRARYNRSSPPIP